LQQNSTFIVFIIIYYVITIECSLNSRLETEG